jgi:hypothetical protein
MALARRAPSLPRRRLCPSPTGAKKIARQPPRGWVPGTGPALCIRSSAIPGQLPVSRGNCGTGHRASAERAAGRPGRVLPRHHVSPRSSSRLHRPWYAHARWGRWISFNPYAPYPPPGPGNPAPAAAAAGPPACRAGQVRPPGPAGPPGGPGPGPQMAARSGTGHCPAARPDIISGRPAPAEGCYPANTTSQYNGPIGGPAYGAANPIAEAGARSCGVGFFQRISAS